jgi:hypothetical protein
MGDDTNFTEPLDAASVTTEAATLAAAGTDDTALLSLVGADLSAGPVFFEPAEVLDDLAGGLATASAASADFLMGRRTPVGLVLGAGSDTILVTLADSSDTWSVSPAPVNSFVTAGTVLKGSHTVRMSLNAAGNASANSESASVNANTSAPERPATSRTVADSNKLPSVFSAFTRSNEPVGAAEAAGVASADDGNGFAPAAGAAGFLPEAGGGGAAVAAFGPGLLAPGPDVAGLVKASSADGSAAANNTINAAAVTPGPLICRRNSCNHHKKCNRSLCHEHKINHVQAE